MNLCAAHFQTLDTVLSSTWPADTTPQITSEVTPVPEVLGRGIMPRGLTIQESTTSPSGEVCNGGGGTCLRDNGRDGEGQE